ncbi:putative ATPase/DNA-binding SARP family transcriptional activator [Nocardia sp. GAS34]|uniref:BTAD domain-containing putative transcriptional regulator n=1 Tax=unclassified Nocardia TaxID=2637762 RepID=UPI003D25EE0C
MQVSVLGPVRVRSEDGTVVDIGGVRLRMLLARLALEHRRAVSVDSLIDGLWGEDPPAEAPGALQALVSRLRRALGAVGAVERVGGGYRLGAGPEDTGGAVELDAERFEDLVRRGRRELAADDHAAAAANLDAALRLWQGPALADVREAPFARDAATRLDELRAAAAADRFDAELRLGHHDEVLPDLEAAAAEQPLSERLAALRMRALAAAGRQADALEAYEAIRARLGDELGIDPSAELRETHMALLRGEFERPRARVEPPARRLPAQRTSFVGRSDELRRLATQLADSRLVTIVGPGGAGKTRLSLEAISRSGHDRVWFVPLAGVSAPEQLTDAVAGALHSLSGAPAGAADPIDRLAGLLDVGAAILLLDNCEHLIQPVAELAEELLDRLPLLRILATSREPLAIGGEVLCHLGPLEVPADTADLAQAAQNPAVRLFLDRAAAVRPDFVLDARTLAPVAEICRQLDGIPLALELAAARLRGMSVEQIAQRLGDRFRLLTSGSRTALPRQRTLEALVEWSWDLLTEPEATLARRLSAFPGGANLEALEAICADDSLPADDILDLAGTLVEKSLVRSTGGESPRYGMLETIRAYAADRLERSGDELSDRFAAHYLSVAQRYEPKLRAGEQLGAIAVFDAEHENMVAALRAQSVAQDPALLSRFVGAMFWYWGIRGMSGQFETFVDAALAAGDALPEGDRNALRVVRLMAGSPVVESDSARTLLEDCLSGRAQEFHPVVPVWVLLLAFRTGNSDLAQAQVERALSLPDPWARASVYLMQDFALTEDGEQPVGAHARQEALREFGIVGDRWGLRMALLAIGVDHSLEGDHANATAVFERAARVAAELGTEDDITEARTAVVHERMRAGENDRAAADIEDIRGQAAERGMPRLGAGVLLSLTELHRRRGDFPGAEEALDLLTTQVRRLPYPEPIGMDLIAAARMTIRLAQRDAPGARELLPLAARGAFAQGHAATLAETAEHIAELHALEVDPEGAAAALGMSEVIRGRFDDGEPILRTLIATLRGQLGDADYLAAYGRGRDLPRAEALRRLAEIAGQPA